MKIQQVLLFIFLVKYTSCSLPGGKEHDKNSILWEKEWQKIDSSIGLLHTDFEKTSFLRSYCGSLIDIGRPDAKAIQYFRNTSFADLAPATFYPLFRNDSMPGDCGIVSYFYIKLAQSFGYKSYQYSFGFTDKNSARFIHSFPIVEINFNGEKRLIIQDPYLNLTFKNISGEPIGFYDFLTKLKQGKYNAVIPDTQTVYTNLLIKDTSTYWPYLSDSCKSLMRQMIVRPGGSILKKIIIARNYKTLMQSACDNFEEGFTNAMHEHGYNEPFIYAYTLRVNEMAGSADVKSIQAKIDSCLSNATVDNPF